MMILSVNIQIFDTCYIIYLMIICEENPRFTAMVIMDTIKKMIYYT
jgi:hypothetical protein